MESNFLQTSLNFKIENDRMKVDRRGRLSTAISEFAVYEYLLRQNEVRIWIEEVSHE